MKITVINGTEKSGVTFRLKDIFLEPLKSDAEITEFFLPRDGRYYKTEILRGKAFAKKPASMIPSIQTTNIGKKTVG